jgi:Protein of unknown function (DUF3043)
VPSLFRRKSSDLVTDAVSEANTRAGNGSRTAGARSGATRSSGTKAGGAGTAESKSGVSKTTLGAKAAGTKAAASKATPAKATSLKSTTLSGSTSPAKSAGDSDDPSAATARSRGYTASKKDLGQATPKRRAGGRIADPPPANRREAYRRMRAKEREARVEARAGVMAGKEEYLPKRDQGPERSLVRDIVDSRHSVGRYFMPIALGLLLITSGVAPVPIRLLGNVAFYALILLVIADSFLLTRRLRRELTTRFPKSTLPPRSHYFYGIMRGLSFRKLRMPAPKVKVGDKV